MERKKDKKPGCDKSERTGTEAQVAKGLVIRSEAVSGGARKSPFLTPARAGTGFADQ
jgi:hypothetical protein